MHPCRQQTTSELRLLHAGVEVYKHAPTYLIKINLQSITNEVYFMLVASTVNYTSKTMFFLHVNIVVRIFLPKKKNHQTEDGVIFIYGQHLNYFLCMNYLIFYACNGSYVQQKSTEITPPWVVLTIRVQVLFTDNSILNLGDAANFHAFV